MNRGDAPDDLERRVTERTRDLAEANEALQREISEHRKTEAALRRSEAWLGAIFERAAVGLSQISTEGRFEQVNDYLCQLLGRRREQLLTLSVADVTHPDDIAPTLAVFDRIIQTGEPDALDKRYVRPDGEVVYANSALTRLDDDRGEARGVLTVTVDLTQRKRAEQTLRDNEQRLKELNRSLEQRVHARTAELEHQAMRLRRLARELASAEHRERKRLAALLHDELQQLLVAAKMRLALPPAPAGEASQGEAVADAMHLIDEAVRASRDLTRQLRPPVLYEEGLVSALPWLASEMDKRHGLRVQLETDTAEPPLNDEVRALLFECVRELLFNVVKHAGVEEATVRVHHYDQQLQIVVEDAGVGFDPRQGEQQTSGDKLGLFSVHERLAALGGRMTTMTTPGHGTRVTLSLPLAPPDIPATPAPMRTGGPTTGPLLAVPIDRPGDPTITRVLVVDDHTIVRQGLANILNGDPRLRVIGEAGNGVDAIEAVRRHRPDVVLMDVNMPQMNGVEATRQICRQFPAVTIIGLSVQSDDATAKAMLDAGAAAFMPKTGDADQMITTVLNLGRRPPPASSPES